MADSLDDFFAKKDKKRGKDKSKSSVLSADLLVKELEEGSKQLDYPTRKEAKTSTAIELLGLDADDADWKDFEDIEQRDYTGLKVKEMSLQDQNDEDQRRLSSDQTDAVPESMPWKIREDQASSAQPATNESTFSKLITDAKSQPQSASKSSSIDDKKALENTIAANNKSDTAATSSTTATPTPAAAPTASSSSLDQNNDEQESNKASTNQASDDKQGDKTSAKKAAYVPPQARLQQMNSEVKILEPSRLGKSRPTNRAQEVKLNFQDESDFPSLG